MNAHQNILDSIAEDHLQSIDIAYHLSEYFLSRFYQSGIKRYGGSTSPLYETRQMVLTCPGLFSHILNSLKSPIRVYVKTNPNIKPPKDVRGLVLFMGKTAVIPMRVSPSLVRIGKTEIFLDEPGGAKALLDVIRAELEVQIKPTKPIKSGVKKRPELIEQLHEAGFVMPD
jgi:hypothetical protein